MRVDVVMPSLPLKEVDKTVWYVASWSDTITVSSGQAISYELDWNQITSRGEQAASGWYWISPQGTMRFSDQEVSNTPDGGGHG